MILDSYKKQFTPKQLDNLFALYDADEVSGVTVVEESDASTITSGKVTDSGHTWTDSGPNNISKRLDAGIADGVVVGEIASGNTMGLAFRAADQQNGLFAFSDGADQLELWKLDAGANIQLAGTSNGTAPDGSTIRVAFRGDSIKVWVNPVDPETEAPLIDHTLSSSDYTKFGTNTWCGFWGHTGTEPSCSTFKVETLDQVTDHTVAYDSFTRADSDTVGSTEVGGLVWTENTGNAKIDNNKLTGNVTGIVSVDAGISDAVISSTVQNTTSKALINVFRMLDSDNYLYLLIDDGLSFMQLFKREAGSPVFLNAEPYSLSIGEIVNVRIAAVGDRIIVFLNDEKKMDYTLSEADQTTYGSNTQYGFTVVGPDGSTLYDNFRVRRPTTLPVWPDVSRVGTDRVNANHAVNTTAAEQPLWIEDWHKPGVSTVEFDGVDDILIKDVVNQTQPISYWFVGKMRTNNTQKVLEHQSSNPGAALYVISSVGERSYAGSILTFDGSPDSDSHVWGALWNTTNSSLRKDGIEVDSGDIGTQVLSQINIGNNVAKTAGMEGVLDIIAIQNSTTSQQLQFESWAENKYPEVTLT